jgi:hypothetical protein
MVGCYFADNMYLFAFLKPMLLYTSSMFQIHKTMVIFLECYSAFDSSAIQTTHLNIVIILATIVFKGIWNILRHAMPPSDAVVSRTNTKPKLP